ncbi:MAG TPA: L,D-transpeptidase [Phycisphaerae bacterium]|nr:L,D-transpeptidase [Phycisphaerae bacterium]
MSRTLHIATSALLLAACGPCPECPPCPGAIPDGGADGARPANAGIEWDTADGGLAAAQVGGKPSAVTSYELHGRAGFDRVSIWSAPDMNSPRLGYFRKGTRTRLGDPRYATEDCPKGWYRLPEGGFVCQGRGMLVGTRPRAIRHAPPPARFDELDPYRHGFIRKDWTPAYRRLPVPEEMWKPPEKEPDGGLEADAGTAEPEIIPHSATGEEGCVDYYAYTKQRFKAVGALLNRGFWVAASERIFDDTSREYYYETITGQYVPGNAVHLVRPPQFRGYEVLGDSPLPAAIVTSRNAAFFELRGGKFRGAGPVDRLTVHRVFEVSETKGGTYYKIEGERWLKDGHVEFFALSKPPVGVSERQKWIRVDLTRQTLEAYEGSTPVYATLISSGIPNDPEIETPTETPTGRFHVLFKHVTDNMTGTVGDDESYSVEDVPWVQYIHRNIALHAAFWHSKFGSPKSHGCINLSPADARFLFAWSDPPLPQGWHGVAAADDAPGTVVIIEGKAPK